MSQFSTPAYFFIAGCDAAAGETGDVCGTSSACTDATNAVCDKVYEKCCKCFFYSPMEKSFLFSEGRI